MKSLIPLLATFGLSLLPGCWHASPTVVFHTLQPLSVAEAPTETSGKGMALEIMPVQLPELLQRSQIVYLKAPGTYGLSDTHRWGNTLEKDMQQVLAENLSVLLHDDAVVLYPQGERFQTFFRVALEVLQCDGEPGGMLRFRAIGTVMRCGNKQRLLSRRFDFQEPANGPGIEGLVQAHNRVLERLSQELATALTSLPAAPTE
jgi:uncharacterized protein